MSETTGLTSATVVVQFPIPSFDVLAVVMLAGQVIVGGVISFNVIAKVVVSVFPFPSLAVMVISWVALFPLITVPEAGDCVLLILPTVVQLSAAVAKLV